MSRAQEFEDILNAIPHGERGSEERALYHERQQDVMDEFREYLADTHGYDFTPAQQAAVYDRAIHRADGGLYSIEVEYEEIADFVRDFNSL